MNVIDPNYRDILSALAETQAEFLVVGAFAVAVHGLPRYTKDIDIWFRPSQANAQRVWDALARFGAPLDELKPSDLIDPNGGFQVGIEPSRIDLFSHLAGLAFEEAWSQRIELQIDGVPMPTLAREHLIHTKLVAGRPQDHIDVQRLRQQAKNLSEAQNDKPQT